MEQLVPLDTASLLRELGYEYYSYSESAVRPDLSDVEFMDVLKGLELPLDGGPIPLAGQRLYRHQEEAYRGLSQGKNLVLRSGTGSGKTEAWLLYAVSSRSRTLAVYPTLALANDQVRRIMEYSKSIGFRAEVLDALRRDELIEAHGRAMLRANLASMDVLVTNPALLMNEVKKMASGSRGMLLDRFLSGVRLIVLDELDFYGPREIALLLSMLRLIRDLASDGFRVAVLTATLSNPGELAKFLEGLTGAEAAVVEGQPFRVENRVYVVLGKDLHSVWEGLRHHADEMRSSGEVGDDVLEALEDYGKFKLNHYKVMEAARSLGIRVQGAEADPAEVIGRYASDPGVTLVFTRNIAKAEELARRLRRMLPPELGERVVAHHHLASRQSRAMAEELARRGDVKVLISPRTLAQGLDIGLVSRIVHVGLPESVREFRQREGRKGRRENLAFSETVVLPLSRWDRELLARGVGALRKWMELPTERALVNPENKYMRLFESMARFISPSLRRRLSADEYEFLRSMGVVEGNELTAAGKGIWRSMNFYEFAPPYGIKRVMESEQGSKFLEDVSHCDLVEKFQPGGIDYSSDGIVVELRQAEGPRRAVAAVVERRLSERTLWNDDSLAQVYQEYEKAKLAWGERPDVFSDYVNGRVHSDVHCVVYPPRGGFGRYVKVPNRVVWRVYSSSPRSRRIGAATVVRREMRTIDVPSSTSGRYSDFTYGTYVELDPSEDVNMINVGLAYLMLVLRRREGLAFGTITYDVGKVGERKYMGLYEPESAGLLGDLDWLRVRGLVEGYEPDELDDVLMSALDERAYSDFLSYGLRWDLARAHALRAVDYLLARERIALSLGGRRLSIPRPSRALKLAALDALSLPLDDEERITISSVALYDGEATKVFGVASEFGVASGDLEGARGALMAAIDSGSTVLVYGFDAVVRSLESAGLPSLGMLLRAMNGGGKLVDVGEELASALGLSAPPPLEEASAALLRMGRRFDLAGLRVEYESARSRLRGMEYGDWGRATRYLEDALDGFVEESSEAILLLHLAADAIRRSPP